jgi:CO/xanthine dehydrogenase FAD-binding subunit
MVEALELVTPATPDEAIAALHAAGPDGAVVVAGGTDLLFDLDDGRIAPRRLVSLRRLPWRTLDWNGDALTIGSTLPLRAIELDRDVRRRIPGLYAAIRAVGSVALRHQATIGGNLGRSAPASDLIPMLLALDAEVDLVGPRGERRVSVNQFVVASRRTALAPAEIIRSVRIPEARPSAYLLQRVRPFHDISHMAVAVAYVAAEGRWRVAVSGFPPRPIRIPDAEEVLVGLDPEPPAVERAAEIVATRAPIVADRRASEAYRRHLVRPLLARALAAARVPPNDAGASA